MQNPEMVLAILQALLGQDPMQNAQYDNRYPQRQMPAEPYGYPPGVSEYPKRRFESSHPKQRFESSHPKNYPQGGSGGSVGDDFFSDPRFRNKF